MPRLPKRSTLNQRSKKLGKEMLSILCSAKIATAHFKRRFDTKDPKTILLTLEVVDLAMTKCGNPLHV